MKTKAMALMMAAVMVLTVTTISVGSIDTDSAEGESKIVINEITEVQMDKTESVTLTVNEKEFSGYNYTLSWYATQSTDGSITNDTQWGAAIVTSTRAADDDTPTIDSSTTGAQIGHLTVKMDGVEGVVGGDTKVITGKYSVNLSADSSTEETVHLVLKCEMVLTVGGDSKKMTPLYYHIPIKTTTSPSTVVNFEDMRMEVAVPYRLAIKSDELGSIDQYVWYAIGLPDGLSMSSSGYVSGIPTKATTGAVDVIVVAMNSKGTAYSGTLKVTVGSATHTSGEYNYVVTVNGSDGSINAQSSLATQGDDVKLTIKKGSDYISGETWDASKVTVINSEGVQASISSTSKGVYTLDTTGTGAYKIIIEYPEGSPVTLTLYVSPALENIAAGIIVS